MCLTSHLTSGHSWEDFQYIHTYRLGQCICRDVQMLHIWLSLLAIMRSRILSLFGQPSPSISAAGYISIVKPSLSDILFWQRLQARIKVIGHFLLSRLSTEHMHGEFCVMILRQVFLSLDMQATPGSSSCESGRDDCCFHRGGVLVVVNLRIGIGVEQQYC